MKKERLVRKTWICPYCGKWKSIEDAEFHLILHGERKRNIFQALEDPRPPKLSPQTTLLDFCDLFSMMPESQKDAGHQ